MADRRKSALMTRVEEKEGVLRTSRQESESSAYADGQGGCGTVESKVQPHAHYFRPRGVRGTELVGLTGVIIATTSLLSDVGLGGGDGKAVAPGLRLMGEGYYTRSP
ncbi:hypothetical protein N7510_011030 [Penicillium lagena]|uniref:uncharacterized protein n=1 Tax=Penicillium lagena TaxID=94218 RepID=UPI002540B1F9|nr:uncharacterized protein N7510_011030 [Penicillium lagena]KAJ5601496.1 hypothetical protein N7510_011030 [Penicillium lagena]